MATAALAELLRAAIIANSAIVAMLPAYKGSYTVFTKIPVPADTLYPMIVVSPDMGVYENDGVNFFLPTATRTVTVYGANDTAVHYRAVDTLAYLIRNMFHRQKNSIGTVPSWYVVQITAVGPEPAPTDDQNQTEGRVVTLSIQLAQQRT